MARNRTIGKIIGQPIGFRSVRAVAVTAIAILVAGGCTHAVRIDSPAEAIAVDISVHIQQEIVLTAARRAATGQ